jgi:hypothetical protein
MSNPYAAHQLARALVTGTTHEDEETRRRADERAQGWMRVLAGIAQGSLRVGSRTPVRGLPVWVTLEVLRGGFASGRAAAGGPLADDERQRADRLGLQPDRRALFASWLTDDGLAELNDLIERDAYQVDQPENAALLVVAWLVAAGDRAAALELLEVIGPYANRLRFAPRVAVSGRVRSGEVWRRTAGEVRDRLVAMRTPRAISAEREALGVWLPLTDRFLALWWETRAGSLETVGSDHEQDWTPELERTATNLVAAYEAAAVQHRLCGKYRDPKENLPILVSLTRARLAGPLTEGQRRRATSTVAAIVAKTRSARRRSGQRAACDSGPGRGCAAAPRPGPGGRRPLCGAAGRPGRRRRRGASRAGCRDGGRAVRRTRRCRAARVGRAHRPVRGQRHRRRPHRSRAHSLGRGAG